MPEVSSKIPATQAQEILDSLVGKDIYLSCGYGGVMFVEIGNVTDYHFEHEKGKKSIHRYGDYRLYCDDNWNFSDGKNVHIDRWTSTSLETDEMFETLGVQKIEKVEVINNFEKTVFHISGGHRFTIIREDSIDTFSLVMNPEKKKLVIFGNGDIDFSDYEEDKDYLKKSKPRPKPTKTFSIDRDFLRNFMSDELPISIQKATEFIQPTLNQNIRDIEITSGTTFTLSFGDDSRWRLNIDELWVLKKEGKTVLDVRNERFHFAEKLVKMLQKNKLLTISFDRGGRHFEIVFSGGYTLTLLESNRHARWYLHDYLTGLSVGSHLDQGLFYRIHSPTHLSQTYDTGDIH